jgi:hypothetical protein
MVVHKTHINVYISMMCMISDGPDLRLLQASQLCFRVVRCLALVFSQAYTSVVEL